MQIHRISPSNKDFARTKQMSNKRPYEQSHPFIRFELDFKKLSAVQWTMLGEIKALANRVANIPLPPVISVELGRVYLSRGINATTAIEGNTLTESEVRAVLDEKVQIPPSREYLAQEVQNMQKAYEWAYDAVLDRDDWKLTPDFILGLNRVILSELKSKDKVVPDEFRTYSVGVGQYRGAPWEDCEYLVERLCGFVNESLELAHSQRDLGLGISVCVAIASHVLFELIHPFGDGNGRGGRLLESSILLEAGVPDLAIHLLSNFYNKTKTKYIEKLQESTERGLSCFLEYAIEGFRDELREQMQHITEFQISLTWQSYIDSVFRNAKKTADLRRKELANRLPTSKPWGYNEMLEKLQRDLYLGKTSRTLQRDLAILEEQGLAYKASEGYLANVATVLQFLPLLKQPEGRASCL